MTQGFQPINTLQSKCLECGAGVGQAVLDEHRRLCQMGDCVLIDPDLHPHGVHTNCDRVTPRQNWERYDYFAAIGELWVSTLNVSAAINRGDMWPETEVLASKQHAKWVKEMMALYEEAQDRWEGAF